MKLDPILVEKIRYSALTITIISWSIVLICIPVIPYNNPVSSQSTFTFVVFDSIFIYVAFGAAISGIVTGIVYFSTRKMLKRYLGATKKAKKGDGGIKF